MKNITILLVLSVFLFMLYAIIRNGLVYNACMFALFVLGMNFIKNLVIKCVKKIKDNKQ